MVTFAKQKSHIMADQHIDIERMVMQARYAMQLEQEAASVRGGELSDMEREEYQNRIKDLLNAVETLLKSNKALGERVSQLEKMAEAYEDLKAQNAKLEGELAMRKRAQHGKGSEKPKDDSSSSDDKTKDDDENDYIENGSRNDIPPKDDEQDEEETIPAVPQEKKPRDLSNRPEHYNKMHADICVVHDCDMEKLKEMGLEFIRYTRPVDQFDRVSLTRQDRYLYVWVRDKKTGKEFAAFFPKPHEEEQRECVFVNESTKVKQPDGSYSYVKRYMWVIVNLATKVCYYLFGRRKREVIEKFLGDFQGTLMTDAYNAYAYFNNLDGCTHACCWAHVRRIFWSALKDYKDPLAQEYIDKIGVLYKVELESILLHRTEAEVLEARKIESIPILNELDQESALLLAKVKSKELKISSKLEKALNYMRNHWKELIAYIDIGNVLIDNNCCERAVRPFTNLRKSFGGFSSELGGEVAAAWLTFVESCKLQKKAALEVFNGYFQRIAEGRRDYDLITEEVLC